MNSISRRNFLKGAAAGAAELVTFGALINGMEENDVLLGDNDKFTTIEEAKEIAKTLVIAGTEWLQVRVDSNGQERTA